MRKYTGIAFLIVFAVLIGFRIYSNIVLKQELTGHLKRAADANSVELALKELEISLNYIEENNLTFGYTSLIYQTPDEDLEFWYKNLKASKAELEITKDSTPLEKTNVLIKLRETLLDVGEKGSYVTYPKGLSIFPHNKLFAVLILLSLAFIPLLAIEFMKLEKKRKKDKKEKKQKSKKKHDKSHKNE